MPVCTLYTGSNIYMPYDNLFTRIYRSTGFHKTIAIFVAKAWEYNALLLHFFHRHCILSGWNLKTTSRPCREQYARGGGVVVVVDQSRRNGIIMCNSRKSSTYLRGVRTIYFFSHCYYYIVVVGRVMKCNYLFSYDDDDGDKDESVRKKNIYIRIHERNIINRGWLKGLCEERTAGTADGTWRARRAQWWW